MRLGDARPPEGMRIYAIGDIHGCLGQLTELHKAIDDDLKTAPVADYRIIHLGDLIDRGPDSAGVAELLSSLTERDPRVLALTGNHDVIFLEFMAESSGRADFFLQFGGVETLRSYGCVVDSDPDARALAAIARERVPDPHVGFLRALPRFTQFGDYFFCHAGIRPGVPLAEQDPDDLIWIRDEFLRSRADHGVVVVHGHTPADAPEVMTNRINVDTGAVFGGVLTCVVLEETKHRFLEAY